MTSLLVRGGTVVTMDPDRRVMDGDVYAVDGRVEELPSTRTSADVVIDASGQLVVPGFVQTHVHLCQSLFRGLADDMDVVDWLRLRIWPLEQALDAEATRDSALLGIAEMLLGGTTAALTIETVRHTEEVLRAVVDSGFRAVSGKAMMDRLEPGTEMVGETTEEAVAESMALLESFHGAGGGRLRYAFCPRGARNATDDLWRETVRLAEEHDAWIHTHAAENEAQTERLAALGGGTDVTYLGGLGVLGPRTVLAHCVWVDDEEIRLLAASGATVAHCPSSNMKLASGFARVPEMLAAGVNVGLGADASPCNNNLDALQEMRLAALIHKPRAGPTAMTAMDVLEMATLRGARALGLQDEIGSLEPGKRADMVMVRRDRIHARPDGGRDPVAQLVYELRSADVDTVIVDGRVLVQGGRLAELDEAEIRTRADGSVRRVMGRAGLR
ncbi:MAG: 5'-deoxyadenosine deaminase [Actinobacteria bacterium]|nr:5'-deoxyadenosine deaminase [Actinomycetota bacterium]